MITLSTPFQNQQSAFVHAEQFPQAADCVMETWL